MSYFSQIAQRSGQIGGQEVLQPTRPVNTFSPEAKLTDPFVDAEDHTPLLSPVADLSRTPIVSPQWPSPLEQNLKPAFIPQVQPEKGVATEAIIVQESITEIHHQVEPSPSNIPETPKQEMKPTATSKEMESTDHFTRKKSQPKGEHQEKIHISASSPEIPPVSLQNFRPAKPKQQKSAEASKPKKKNIPVEVTPQKQSKTIEEEKTSPTKVIQKILPPPGKTVLRRNPKRKTTESKVSIGKITVEVIPPTTASKPTTIKTIYQQRPVNASRDIGENLRYNHRFGLGQL